jgi:hypothetical protein
MARRKKRSGRGKKSLWTLGKGALYVGAVAAPMYAYYEAGGKGSAAAVNAIKAAAFIDPGTDSFSFEKGAQIWTPVAAVALVDFVTSKVGLQKRISSAIGRAF